MNDLKKHYKTIKEEVAKNYEIANAARAKGYDPTTKVETPIAISLAEKAIGLISVVYPQLNDPKLVKRIIELEKKYGQLTVSVCLGVAEDIAREKYCKFKDQKEAIDAGIRVAFSYFTLGVVSSPIEGYTGLKFEKTKDGKEYFKVYFSGPIRSAGTTAGCVALMVMDYLRETFGYAKYDPTEDEVKRYVTENYDYHERVTNLQYLPTEEEITFLAKNLPIQIAGEPTEQREVSNYKDLPRVETNQIRGGMCLIFSEGLAQKAAKGYRLLKIAKENGYKTTGFDFLQEYVDVIHKKSSKASSEDSTPTYIKDIVAGRPIYSHPGRSGGFRFRYGRARTAGFSATSIHPATMGISNEFLSTGTQLKIEKPTKGCAISMTEEIEGPTIRIKGGTVIKPQTKEEAAKLYSQTEEIIYLGDLLFPFGDVLNRNSALIRPGYVEEWWEKQLQKNSDGKEKIQNKYKVKIEKAKELSKKYKIPLHPEHTLYWTQITKEQFLSLIDWLARATITESKLILPYNNTEKERFAKAKRALELLGCEHEVTLENTVLTEENTKAILTNIGVENETKNLEEAIDKTIIKIPKEEEKVLTIVNKLSEYEIKDKAGEFIGARMGRPEKAKLRKLIGSPHALFPVGNEGGRLRSFQAANEGGSIKSEFPNYYCTKCKNDTIYPKCEVCEETCKKRYYCYKCDTYSTKECEPHEIGSEYRQRRIDSKHYFDQAKKLTNTRIEELPVAVKGVRSTSSADHSCEHLAKGLLRAKYNLHVNKDGTIRYDMTEMPITHFKPKEIGTSIQKLKELGYEQDKDGKKLEEENQILEIFPHDIILPSCPDSPDEPAEEVFLKISQFIDDELEKLYKLPKKYNAKTKKDIIGTLFACIAPHICTATVGRLIGFTKTQAFFTSPYMHAAMRRDCDGDEAAVIFLTDMLLNFSRKFLPSHRGGTQDAPLVLNTQINAGEVDDQILDVVTGEYPLELYELAEQKKHSSEVKIETVAKRLKEEKNPYQNIHYTHETQNLNDSVLNSSYKLLPTMEEKVQEQMRLCQKIRAVDTTDVARLIIERHFIRDIRGNLRKFSMQVFRCVGCNEKFRRPPLLGKCTKCGGKIIFTISEGSIKKYLDKALNLARKYKVSDYLLENLEITEKDIESIFGKEKEKQQKLFS